MAKEFKGVRLSQNGHLVVQYTDNTSTDLGPVVGVPGTDGADGVGVVRGYVDNDNRLRISLSNGVEQDWGPLRGGPVGPKGDTGAAGPQGVKGDRGETGPQGPQGVQGAKGDRGDTGLTGPKGDTGDKGDKGDAGEPGSANTAFTATGATALRTLAERASEVANLLDYVMAGETNFNNAMQRAIDTGKPVEVPWRAAPYTFSATYTLPAGATIYGKGGRPVLKKIGNSGMLFRATGVSGVTLRDLVIDGSEPSLIFASAVEFNNSTDCVAARVRLQGCKRGFMINGGSTRIKLDQWETINMGQHGVEIEGASTYGNTVTNGYTEGGQGFGIILLNRTYQNTLSFNRSTHNEIELIGITAGCRENKVIGNHVEGVSDTGISVTGDNNTVVGNTVKNCEGNGIHVYGSGNTVTGNVCMNNCQNSEQQTEWKSGIHVQPSFGGLGQDNIITGNICDDDQTSPTQIYGVGIGAHTYPAWYIGATINLPDRYMYNGLNVYRAKSMGTTGGTAPTHTLGIQSDGGVDWEFVATARYGTLAPSGNTISANKVRRYKTAKYNDNGGGTSNEFNDDGNPFLLPANLTVSSLGNVGGVGAITVPLGGSTSYQWTGSSLNGVLPSVVVSAPTSQGSVASARVDVLFLKGNGTITTAGTGYVVGDILTISGGQPVVSGTNFAASTGRRIRVTAVNAEGGITGFTNDGTGAFYYTAPWPDNTTLTGGTGTGARLSNTAWTLGANPVVTASGSGYVAQPTITFVPAFGGSASITVTLTSTLTVAAGGGSLIANGTGTVLGVQGVGGKPIVLNSAQVDASATRVALTGSGYTVPVNTSLVRFSQSATIASSTVTLPTPSGDGHMIQFANYAGAVTAFTFSPAVQGFTNGNTLSPHSGVRIRWDATDSAWHREQ